MSSPVSSGRAFYVLQTPGDMHLSVWNRSVSISTYFCLSIYLNIDLHVQISSQAEADSYSSLSPTRENNHSLFQAQSWCAHPWCDLMWSPQRHHCCSQQSLHLTICTSQLNESWSPSAHAHLPTQVHDYWMYQWSSSGTHVPQGHEALKTEWEGHVHWPLVELRGSRKLKNSLHYSQCAALLSLCSLSLACWIKMNL